MTTFESEVKTIFAGQQKIFQTLSNLKNLEKAAPLLTNDKIKNLRFDEDSCFATIDMVGEIGLRIIEREPFKTIKFQPENSPITFNLWIQLVEKEENRTKMKVVLKSELGMMMKGLASKPLQKFVDVLADGIEKFSFND